MNRLVRKLAMMLMIGSLLHSTPAATQVSPTTKKAARGQITQGPEIALAKDWFTVIRWTTNNPGGSPVHYGIVHYGTGPKDLSQTAKNPIRLNPYHSSTVFRVHLYNLKPQTPYYYKVTSIASNGKSDGMESSVNQFTTPGTGQRVVNYPPQPARPR